MLSSSSRQTTLISLTILVLVCSLFGNPKAQQFYPNGRYGRRDAMPPLSDISGNREMTVSFFGDGVVQCVYTGYSDYYRCARKFGNNPSSTSVTE